MTARQLFVAGAALLAAAFSGSAAAQPAAEQYVQVAHIEIDPVQLEEYRAAVREQITAAIRDEPGVLVLYAVSDKDNPARVTVFEIYHDAAAYQAHLASVHFKKYKAATENGEVTYVGEGRSHSAWRQRKVTAVPSNPWPRISPPSAGFSNKGHR